MVEDYFYSAFTYVDEWIAKDRHFRNELGYSHVDVVTDDEAREYLLQAAKHYGVARNFKRKGEILRLGPAWDALKQEKNPPQSRKDAIQITANLVEKLRGTYENDLWSAASKFLWLRFGSPIIIYDSIAWNWMHGTTGCESDGNWYEKYCAAWITEFEDRRQEINLACAELPAIRKFMRPNDLSSDDLIATVSSDWFAERVFDHFMLNAEEERVMHHDRADDPSSSVQ